MAETSSDTDSSTENEASNDTDAPSDPIVDAQPLALSDFEIKFNERLDKLLKQVKIYTHRIEFGTSKVNGKKPCETTTTGQP